MRRGTFLRLGLTGVIFGGMTGFRVVASAQSGKLPSDSQYVAVDKQGHLICNGQRIRFWGAIGWLPPEQKTIKNDPYYAQRETVRRVKKVGFNMVRDWNIQTDAAAKKGDLSPTDAHDFFLAECGRQGVHVWAPSVFGGSITIDEVAKAAQIVTDADSAAEWTAATQRLCKVEWWSNGKKALSLLVNAVVWDSRLEALAVTKAREKALHVNLHNGLRLADDPTFAVWELTNEQWWMSNMMNGGWLNLPPYFRKTLLERWNAYLTKKYGTQGALVKAWGFTFPGEDLTKKTILFAPMANARSAAELNDANPAAAAVFKNMQTVVGREQCTTARGGDVIAFLLELLISHKKRCAAELKTWGKSCRLSPVVFDTGIGQSIQAQFMQMQGDAVAHDSYMEGIQTDKFPRTHKRWPFYSGLDNPPQLSNDVPWLEHNRPIDKPFFVYETQFGGPTKYRAEWPLRIAAAGAIQDWEAVCWHYWSFNQYDLTKDTPYTGLGMAFPGDGAYQYDYTSDETEQAAMRAAGAILRNSLAAPAPRPTIFSWGLPALLDPRTMDYAGDYDGGKGLMDMMATAYSYGERIVIDPNQKEFLKTIGPVTRWNGFEKSNPLKASSDVEFDYQRGHLIFDAPGVASYTGFLGQRGSEVVAFRNGVALRDVKHNDPAGMPFPSGAERYTSFTLASEDGRPLAQCRQAVIALVSAAFNTGTKVETRPDGSLQWDWGHAPILVTRVGATVAAKALAGMRYRMIDFNERILAAGTVGPDGILRVPADKPVWFTELTR